MSKDNAEKKETGYTELEYDSLKWSCPIERFSFASTEEVESLQQIVGQPRAIESIRLGAELPSKGYNIFVSGLSGTGRLSTVKMILEEVTTSSPVIYDFCYVYNFSSPDTPRLIKLAKGQGREFSKAIDDTVSFLRTRLQKIFEDESYLDKRNKIIEDYQQKERDILEEFDNKIKPFGFIRGQLESEQGGAQPEVFPVVNDKPVQIENLDELISSGALTQEKAQEIKANYIKFHNEIFELARLGLKLMQEFRKTMFDNDKASASIILDSVFNQINETYNYDSVKAYLDEMKKYMLENINMFFGGGNPLSPGEGDGEAEKQEVEDKFELFKVNVILDNTGNNSAPVIVETNPSYTNLFGTIERSFDSSGYWRTDFMKIKAGSVLKADQGYLIVNAMDLFSEPGVWPVLKRILLYDKLEIQAYEATFQLSQLHLKPEPIDINVKVIRIGGQTLYQYLYEYEKGFKKMFKINAQFDYETERTEKMLDYYTQFISKICKEENLPPCSPDGVGAIIEWAVAHAGSQKRISLKFSDVADVIREAAFYDRNSKQKIIGRNDVKRALGWRRHRDDLIDEKMTNYIMDGMTMIDTDGERVGQINGLAVLDTGIHSFGKPSRITATVCAGSSGIINIERESDMSGSIHNKGVLIISGFLKEKFAKKKPLSFTASIAFEQNYSGIDGDSASAAEIYVLLSALTGIPIRQNFAITGSVNQKGDIQPIGGVNHKIRGFYEICKERGLTGTQGVIIPHQNVSDLMLCDELIDDVKAGKFHIYSIKSIDDGAELLLGIEAGKTDATGKYTKDSLYYKVEKRLKEFRLGAQELDRPKPKKKVKKV